MLEVRTYPRRVVYFVLSSHDQTVFVILSPTAGPSQVREPFTDVFLKLSLSYFGDFMANENNYQIPGTLNSTLLCDPVSL